MNSWESNGPFSVGLREREHKKPCKFKDFMILKVSRIGPVPQKIVLKTLLRGVCLVYV